MDYTQQNQAQPRAVQSSHKVSSSQHQGSGPNSESLASWIALWELTDSFPKDPVLAIRAVCFPQKLIYTVTSIIPFSISTYSLMACGEYKLRPN